MSYTLEFGESAIKEWNKLDAHIRLMFQARLGERLANPHVASAKLSGLPNCYKIKLAAIGYRLVYEVIDRRLVVKVVAIGKRERAQAYAKAKNRVGR